MHAKTKKDFSSIRDDYRFFEEHSTEAAAEISAYLRHFRIYSQARTQVRLLDFGGGDGGFLSSLLEQTELKPEKLEISAVEPVFEYHGSIIEQLSGHSKHKVAVAADVSELDRNEFEIIIANHSLYYVQDISRTARKLLKLLSERGVLLAAMAGRENFLVGIWKRCFEAIGEEIPYWTSIDLEARLDELGALYKNEPVNYGLKFPDTEENRLKVCRFLLGEYFNRVPIEVMLRSFQGYEDGANVRVDISHSQFAIRT